MARFQPQLLSQIAFLAALVRLYRGADLNGYTFDPSDLNLTESQIRKLHELFGNRQSAIGNPQSLDIPGLCKVVTRAEIAAQGWSLNPGRYVGVAEREEEDFDFKERLEEQNEELEILNAEARELEDRIAENVVMLLEAQ